MAKKRQQKKNIKKQSQAAQLKKPKISRKPTKSTNKELSRIGQYNNRELTDYLKSNGFSQSEINQLKSWSASEILQSVKNKQKNERRKQRAEENYQKLIKAGFSSTEANKLKYKSGRAIEEALGGAFSQGLYLLGFVRDKTGGSADAIVGDTTGEWSEAVYWQKEMAKGTGIQTLIEGINQSLNGFNNVGNIGEYALKITTKDMIDNDTRYYRAGGYFKIYQGQGKNYKNLISYINIMMSFLYLIYERDIFIQELVYNLKMLDNSAAHRNAERIEKEFLNE